MLDFDRLNADLLEKGRPADELGIEKRGVLYVLHCLYHQIGVEDIDFTRFTEEECADAFDELQESVALEDEDEMVRFDRESSWATVSYMAAISWNVTKTIPATLSIKPAYPLI